MQVYVFGDVTNDAMRYFQYRQETPLDNYFKKKGPDGHPVAGCRVFGDCDVFMEELMRNILTDTDMKHWKDGRAERMKAYDKLRD